MENSRPPEVRNEAPPYRQGILAVFTLVMIAAYLLLCFVAHLSGTVWGIAVCELPLLAALLFAGTPLVVTLLTQIFRGEFGADLLAGISIASAVVLGEYLAGALVVLMLSGGQALEAFAVRSASSVLAALARRMPTRAHRKSEGGLTEVGLHDVAIGDLLVIFPHEICPVDGTVVAGRSVMDESYLTGEPYLMSKTPGAEVLSGAVNGAGALTVRAGKVAADSRYAKIMSVMRESEQRRPRLRRLGDQLGALYTPLAVTIALAAWVFSGEPVRFLAVLVVATPCPLLIAIPVAIIGSTSLAARRGIIIKDPAVLETIDSCRTAIFDKTGTLTYGEPRLTEILPAPGYGANEVLRLVAGLERYSKHPLAGAVQRAARDASLSLPEAAEISEPPGEGLRGVLDNHAVRVTSRKKLAGSSDVLGQLAPEVGGMECIVLIDGKYAATVRFRDQPRREGASFVRHLKPRHHFTRVMLVSGDREAEVRFLAEQVGISEVYYGQSPEQKLDLVRAATKEANTVFLGDGINDAPALTAATVGIAFGQGSDITAEAADAVVLESSLEKVDEFLHISRRLRAIALQSAVGGMGLSLVAMVFATLGYLPPVAGAITQELIDVAAVLNALRAALPPRDLTDYLC